MIRAVIRDLRYMMISLKRPMAPVVTRFDHFGTIECGISRKDSEKSPSKIQEKCLNLSNFNLSELFALYSNMPATSTCNGLLDYPHNIPHEQYPRD